MKSTQIPAAVERAMLANRQYFRELNAKARAMSGGTSGFATKPDTLTNNELAFWNIEDDGELEEFLFEDLLSALDGNEKVDLKSLPKGYAPLIAVLEFERHSQFEGWTAVSNKGEEEMPDIIKSYRFVGLNDEAEGLTAALKAYRAMLRDDDAGEVDEILGNAYRKVRNSTPEFEDRVPPLLTFVRSNPSLFADVA